MSSAFPGTGLRPLRGAALSLALLSVVAFWPPALDRWILPKVLLLGVAALLATLPAPTGRLPRWLPLALIGAVALLIVAALLGPDPVAAMMGRWPRYEGVVTATSYLVALWLGARLLGPGADERDARLVDRVLGVVAVLLGTVSVAEAVGLRPFPSDLDRPGALLGNATDQGAIAAAIAAILLARLLRGRRSARAETVLLAAAAAIAGLTVLLSGSRAALLVLLLGVIVAGLIAARRRALWVVATAVPVAVSAVLLPIAGRLATSGESVADRLLIWRETLRVVNAHPLLGTGPNGFLDAVASVHDATWFATAGDDTVLDSPHDVLLQALVIGGPLLFTGLLAALVVTVVTLVLRIRAAEPGRRELLLPLSLGAGALFLVLLTHVSAPATMIPLALIVGALVSRPPAGDRFRLGVGIALVAWVTLVGLTLAGESALSSGISAARAGDLDAADAAFHSATALRPWDADTAVIAAEALTARLDGGDTAALGPARVWADFARAAAPGSLAAGKAAATTAIADHDLDRASAVLAGLRTRYPLDPWVAWKAGAVAAARGHLSDAEQLLTLAIALDPDRPDPWLTLAYVYDAGGDTEAAADAQAHAEALGG